MQHCYDSPLCLPLVCRLFLLVTQWKACCDPQLTVWEQSEWRGKWAAHAKRSGGTVVSLINGIDQLVNPGVYSPLCLDITTASVLNWACSKQTPQGPAKSWPHTRHWLTCRLSWKLLTAQLLAILNIYDDWVCCVKLYTWQQKGMLLVEIH